MNKLISVIIPVFNGDKYIGKCVNSILAQTYKLFEIIIVDNGSKDNTQTICTNFLDERIQYIRTEERGVSNARNIGITLSRGEYLFFIDADDWIESETFEIMIKNIKDNCVVCCQFLYDDMFGKNKGCSYSLYGIVEGYELEKMYIEKSKGFIHASSCGKLYNKNSIKNIFFDKNIDICEDLKFCFEVIKQNKLLFLDKYLYHYVRHRQSAISQNFSKKNFGTLNVWKYMLDNSLLEKSILFKRYGKVVISTMFYMLRTNPQKEYYDIIREILYKNKKCIFINLNYKYKFLFLYFTFLGFNCSLSMCKILSKFRKIFHITH